MGPVLRIALGALACAAATAAAQSDRHEFHLDASLGYVSATTELGAWTDGAFAKLRNVDDGVTAFRLFGEYTGRITPTLRARVVADYVDDASGGLDVTEAFLDWRPIPRSRNQHQLRFGAFYPPFSLENGERGWESPFTYSYSAIDTWLGEEVRPVGLEWSLRRRLAGFRSNHEIRAFAAAFYGNDPAGTLLFWRGWSLHDRQSRLNDELAIPPPPNGAQPRRLEPFSEIDDRPGAYFGVEWRYARRALVQLARYDNRADPYSFADGQWGWYTEFDHAAVQLELPARFGLVAQRLVGTTEWIPGARADGTFAPWAFYAHDELESRFVLLTRRLGDAQRLSARYDTFSIERPAASPVLRADSGHAWTLSYRIEPTERLGAGIEWLRIDSRRDLWPMFYGMPAEQTEDQLRLTLSYRLRARPR